MGRLVVVFGRRKQRGGRRIQSEVKTSTDDVNGLEKQVSRKRIIYLKAQLSFSNNWLAC